ncbi:ribosome maturation factor RimP [Bdellovibrionota bacterium FG-1]
MVLPMGYEVVHLEVIPRQKVLRIFIDHRDRADGVGIEDCVKVTRFLDEPLDQIPEIINVFRDGPYDLEVSSPGIDRPLRTQREYEKFAGREVRIHVFRPLTGEELDNPEYGTKNPKQKNFLGTLRGVQNGKVILAVNLTGGHDNVSPDKGSKKSGKNPTNSAEAVVGIPLPLISKANLEPVFDQNP